MPQSLSAVFVHAIFYTRDRLPLLKDNELRSELHSLLGGISKGLNCQPVRVGGFVDHVHILALLGRGVTQSDWIKELKRQSSIWVKERDRKLGTFAWQAGYGAFSVDPTRLDTISRYIEDQEAHHQTHSFQDEFRAILIEYGIEIDERYVWA